MTASVVNDRPPFSWKRASVLKCGPSNIVPPAVTWVMSRETRPRRSRLTFSDDVQPRH